jgi:hypothetical protein
MMLGPCGAVTSAGGTVSRRMPRDICQRRHTASHPAFQDQSRPRGRGEADLAMFVPAALGRVGCKAFDQMAGELKA